MYKSWYAMKSNELNQKNIKVERSYSKERETKGKDESK